MYPNGPGVQPPQGGQPLQGYATPRPTNSVAIAALVSSFVFAPLGIILGHISLSQIKRTGEDGRELAIAGLAIGYLITAIGAISLIILLTGLIAVNSAVDAAEHVTTGSTAPVATPALPARNDNDREFADVTASICDVVEPNEVSELNGRDLPEGYEVDKSSTSRTCSYVKTADGDPGAGVTCHDLTTYSEVFSFFTNKGVVQMGTDNSGHVQWFTTKTNQFVFYTSTTLCVVWSVSSSSSMPSILINTIASRLVIG